MKSNKLNLFSSIPSKDKLIEALDNQLSTRSKSKHAPQQNVKSDTTTTTEAEDTAVLSLLKSYLSHPDHHQPSLSQNNKSPYSILFLDRSLRNAVAIKDNISARLILKTGLANAHYKPQPDKPSAYELIQNSEDRQDIKDIIDAPSTKHHQHAPEFIRSPALFREHMLQIQEKKHLIARQPQQRSIISSLVPFSGKRILDYKNIWGMCISSVWIMAQHGYDNKAMHKAFYALMGFSEQSKQIDVLQEVFDAFQKIAMILQANNPSIRDCITYKNMQTLCENPEALSIIEAKVNAIQADFFTKNTTSTYNPTQIPTTPSGNQRTPHYDDAMQPIMDLCVYGDTIPDELNQLTHIVQTACAEISASSPWFRQQVVQAAALLHHGIIAIHPYADGNGRTARKLASTLCSYYGFTMAKDDVLKSHPAIWNVKGIEYHAHGKDCSAYDVAVAQDFRHMRPYLDGVKNLSTNHFAQWLGEQQRVQRNAIAQTATNESISKTDPSSTTASTSNIPACKEKTTNDTSPTDGPTDSRDGPKP